jgi:hypothetical protein
MRVISPKSKVTFAALDEAESIVKLGERVIKTSSSRCLPVPDIQCV